VTKERLKRYRDLVREEAQLEAELLERAGSSGIGGGALDGMPRGGELSDLTARFAIENVELYAMLTKKRMEIVKERRAIEDFIEELEPVERVLMRERYISGKKWEEVMLVIGYGWHQTHRIHGKVLKEAIESDINM